MEIVKLVPKFWEVFFLEMPGDLHETIWSFKYHLKAFWSPVRFLWIEPKFAGDVSYGFLVSDISFCFIILSSRRRYLRTLKAVSTILKTNKKSAWSIYHDFLFKWSIKTVDFYVPSWDINSFVLFHETNVSQIL